MSNGLPEVMIATGHAEKATITRSSPTQWTLQIRSPSRHDEVHMIHVKSITFIYKNITAIETEQEAIKRHVEKNAGCPFEDAFITEILARCAASRQHCGQSRPCISRREADDTCKIQIQNRQISSLTLHYSTKIHNVGRGQEPAKTVPRRRRKTHHFLKELTVVGVEDLIRKEIRCQSSKMNTQYGTQQLMALAHRMTF